MHPEVIYACYESPFQIVHREPPLHFIERERSTYASLRKTCFADKIGVALMSEGHVTIALLAHDQR